MKKGLGCLSISLGLIAFPFSVYGSWLMYNHVKATELMWFIWWIQIPLLFVSNILSQIMSHFLKEEKHDNK